MPMRILEKQLSAPFQFIYYKIIKLFYKKQIYQFVACWRGFHRCRRISIKKICA